MQTKEVIFSGEHGTERRVRFTRYFQKALVSDVTRISYAEGQGDHSNHTACQVTVSVIDGCILLLHGALDLWGQTVGNVSGSSSCSWAYKRINCIGYSPQHTVQYSVVLRLDSLPDSSVFGTLKSPFQLHVLCSVQG